MEAKEATETDIKDLYFKSSQSALHKAEGVMELQEIAEVTLRYAQFADQQYQLLSQSDRSKQLRDRHSRQTAELAALRKHQRSISSHDEHKSLSAMIRSLQIDLARDKERLKVYDDDLTEYLQVALTMYIKVISSGDSYNKYVLRFCAIWLGTEEDDHINISIATKLRSVASHKFVELAYQLAARLQPNEEAHPGFQANLHSLVTRICEKHPFHMVYQILTLANPTAAQGSSRRVSSNAGPTQRGAHAVLSKVKDEAVARLVEINQMEEYAQVARQWAQDSTSCQRGKGGDLMVPKNSAILSLRDRKIPVPTLTVPVDPSGRYDDIVTLKGYAGTFSLAGGISHPKIMRCEGSDGQTYRELVCEFLVMFPKSDCLKSVCLQFKSNDDARQDTVMEQLFRLVNDLLQQDPETRKRKLQLKTYNVLPLADKTGVIQYVNNTMPLLDYVISAHER